MAKKEGKGSKSAQERFLVIHQMQAKTTEELQNAVTRCVNQMRSFEANETL